MRLYYPVDLANVNIIEKLVLGGTGTGDLPIRAACGRDGPGFQRAGPGQAWPGRADTLIIYNGPGRTSEQAAPGRKIQARHSFLLVFITVFISIIFICITVFISIMLKGETCFK